MGSSTARLAGLFGLVAALAVPGIAAAERLFAPVGGLPSAARGIARVQALALDTNALASVRARREATLSDFPLGSDGTATLAIERFDPFAAGATAVVMEDGGPRALALPDQAYYRGRVEGDDRSIVLLVATPDTARGFVSTGGTIYRFGRDDGGVHRSWSLRDADSGQFPGPGNFCGNEAHADDVAAHAGRTALVPGIAAAPPVSGFSPTLLAQVAIETDQELLAKFASVGDAILYLADLAAAISAIYDADTDVRVKFTFIRLWNAPDPWTATSTLGMLNQLRTYWTNNEGATPRDVAHFVSGKSVIGGIAYLDVLCDPDFGYGVSTVYGEFDTMNPDDTWDVFVMAHELGHNFGSEHTHCYDPPLDNCYNGEAYDGCYAGPESLPMGGGTIMSYCHLLSGGQSNINPTFGPTVSGVLRAGAENGICIGPPCGDGILDPGEECDDDNNVSGDCCSAACLAEADGATCDDGETCTVSDQCAAGACTGTAVLDGTACDDGSLCTDDACQAGACIGVPTPAPVCKTPTLPLKSQLVLKDKLPDKGDQVVWKWMKGQATTLPELGSPDVGDTYELCVYDAADGLLFRGSFPAGGICKGVACWKTLPGKGYAYKDKDRTPDGMEKLQLVAGAAGAAKMSAKGKGDLLGMPALGSLALPVRAQLRGAGGCWGATYSTSITDTTAQFKAKSD